MTRKQPAAHVMASHYACVRIQLVPTRSSKNGKIRKEIEMRQSELRE